MKDKTMSKKQFLADLKTLYTQALDSENYSLALRIKELEAKLLGLLHPPKTPLPKNLKDLTNVELENWITQIEDETPPAST